MIKSSASLLLTVTYRYFIMCDQQTQLCLGGLTLAAWTVAMVIKVAVHKHCYLVLYFDCFMSLSLAMPSADLMACWLRSSSVDACSGDVKIGLLQLSTGQSVTGDCCTITASSGLRDSLDLWDECLWARHSLFATVALATHYAGASSSNFAPTGHVQHIWRSLLLSDISPCTIKSRRSFLLAPVHPGSPGKRAVKWLWGCLSVRWVSWSQLDMLWPLGDTVSNLCD